MAFLAGSNYRGFTRPERQYQFHPTRKWRLDFAWVRERVAVEVEGGIWRRNSEGNWAGAHSHPMNIERDIEKGNALAALGWILVRATDKNIKSGEVFDVLRAALDARKIETKELLSTAG